MAFVLARLQQQDGTDGVLSGVCPGRELLRFFIPWGKAMVSIGK